MNERNEEEKGKKKKKVCTLTFIQRKKERL